MPIFKKLKAYNKQELEGAVFGFGCLKARNYDTGKNGRLFLFSINFKKIKFIKKIFV